MTKSISSRKERESITCMLCGSTAIVRLFPSDGGDVLSCITCGLVFLPHPESPAQMYQAEYFHEREDYFFKDGIIDDSGEEKPHVKDFLTGLKWIEARKQPPGRLLDIGCATGTFLAVAKQRGWECHGVEVSEYAARIARERLQVPVHAGLLEQAGFSGGFFDVITMWDLIEHLPDPLVQLREVRRILQQDGILLVNTPNEDSFMRATARALHRASGGLIQGPIRRLYHRYHLYYFRVSTLNRLFAEAGFEVVATMQKVIPITKGRGSTLAKAIVRGLSLMERALDRRYELFYLVRKRT